MQIENRPKSEGEQMSNHFKQALTRREMLTQCGSGFGMLALTSLMAEQAQAANVASGKPIMPLAVKAPMFPARAKRVIFLFMHGGPSQVDTFDPKPLLTRDSGKPFPGAKPRVQFAQTGNLLTFAVGVQEIRAVRHRSQSDLFPHVAQHVDDLCVVRSMYGSNPAHGGALLALHTGSDTFIRPSMGSWITYGLGTENQNLPGFVTICPTLGHGGVQNWSSAFLPAAYQGTPIGNASIPAKTAAINYIRNNRHPRRFAANAARHAQGHERGAIEAFWQRSAAGRPYPVV